MSGREGFILAHGFGEFQPIVEGGYSGGVGIVGAGERYFTSVGQAAKNMLKPGGSGYNFQRPTLRDLLPGARLHFPRFYHFP